MEKPLKISDELLLDYLDGSLGIDDSKLVEDACKDPAIAKRLEELRLIDQLMTQSLQLESPSINFNANVMANLEKPILEPTPSRRNGLLVLILALCTVVIGALYMTESTVELKMIEAISFESFNKLNKVVEVPTLNLPDSINLKLVTDGLLFTILVLALLLFDKVVLKPYFRNRRAVGVTGG